MKNRPIWSRVKNSINGLGHCWQREQSFRTQTLLISAAIAILYFVAPAPVWIILFLLSAIVGVAFELVNAALEALTDRLHPDHHPEIGQAKDMASASAFVVNCFSAIVLAGIVMCKFAR